MKLHIKIVLTTIVTLLLLIYLAGLMPVFSQAPPNWVITGKIEDIKNSIPVAKAIVTLTDIEGDIHIVSTGEDGYYFFKNLAVGANCVITAIAVVSNKTMIFKDVIPWPVAANATYNAGTADAKSTALALIVEGLVEGLTDQGLTYSDIDLGEIEDSENFLTVEEQVLSVLEDNGNVIEEIVVAGEEVTSDDGGTAYNVTVTLREKISGATSATYTINPSVIGSGIIEPSVDQTVNHNSEQSFTITPALNYHILGITVDGNLDVGPFGSPYTYTFTNVTAGHTIKAYLAIDTYNIAVIVGNNGSIEPSGAVSVNHGSDQTFTIIPDDNYHIDDVLVDGSLVGEVNFYTFENVTEEDHTISATFAIDTYTLTTDIDAEGTGSGTVTPAVDFVHIYNYGDTVTISAEADPSSTFSGWSGDAASENSNVTLTMTKNKDFTASFALNTYTLGVNKAGSGTGTVSIAPVQENYIHGDVVTITTTANQPSSTFTGWAGDNSNDLIDNKNGNYSITMNSNKSVTATFNLKKVTLTVAVAGTGSGKVSPTVGVHTYNYGASVNIGAKADTGRLGTWIATEDMVGSVFAGWRGDASGTGDVTLTMTSNKSITAIFTKREIRTLTMAVDGTGSGTVVPAAGDHMYYLGDEVTIQAIPNKVLGTWIGSKAGVSSVFAGWRGDASGTGDLTLTMDSDKIVTATFTLEKVKLTMAVAGKGSGTTSPVVGTYTYDTGTKVNISASAASGYKFVNWTGATVVAPNSATTTILMDGDKTVTANFARITYTLTTAVNLAGSGSVTGAGTYNSGETATVTATPTSGWKFTGWSGALTVATNPANISMDANKSVTATFSAVDYTVALLVSPTGTGTTSGGGTTYHVGDSVQIKALANSGYTFVNWTADGAVVSTDATHNFTMPAANVNYTANFIMTYSCYGVSSSSDYDAVNNKTTFTYTVWELGVGGCQDISYVQLNFGNTSWDVSMTVDKPPCTKVIENNIIKMDSLQNLFTTGTIT
nr:hypothetical protein [Candidatus Atribacteria bacterium]